MKFAFFITVFIIAALSYIFIKYDKDIKIEPPKVILHVEKTKLELLHEKFEKIDINSEKLDLAEAIKEIKEARKLYPLDNILLRVDIELEHKRANKSYKSTENSTPHN